MRLPLLLLVLILLTGPQSSFADENTDREVVQTYVNYHISQKQYDKAEKRVRDHLADDPNDGERWNLLGLILTKKGDYKGADEAYLTAVAASRGTDKGIYLYNYANSKNKNKRIEEAKRLLNEAKKFDPVEPSATAALSNIIEGEELPKFKLVGPPKWDVDFNTLSGYDTNVQLLARNTLDSIARSDTASPVVILSPSIQYKKDYYHGLLEGNATPSWTYYTNSQVSRFIAYDAAFYAKWTPDLDFEKFKWGLSGKFNITYLSHQFTFYNWNQYFTFESVYQHSARSRTVFNVPIRVQNFQQATSSADERTGFAFGFELSHQISSGKNLFSFGVDFNRAITNGSNFRSYTYNVPLSWSRTFRGFSTSLGLEGGNTWYTESATSRRDLLLNPTAAVVKRFKGGWSGGLNYAYTRNISSVSSASYEKHTIYLAVNYELI